MTVRQGELSDLDSLAPLFDAYRQFYGYASEPLLARNFLSARLERAESTVLLTETPDGEATGFTQLYPTFCSLDAERIYVLYDLFVTPAARRGGAARSLLTSAAEFARAAGASRLDLSTARSNSHAQALYESLGWVRDDVYLSYSLSLER